MRHARSRRGGNRAAISIGEIQFVRGEWEVRRDSIDFRGEDEQPSALAGENRRLKTESAAYFSPLNASHDTLGFQFVNVPLGLSFHAQTCSV